MRSILKVLGAALTMGLLLYGLSQVAMHLGPELNGSAPDGLPLVELPVTGTRGDEDLLAVILSGDGGWADLDRDFGHAFQQCGLATVGFDCLKYFWEPKQPAKVAADLDRALRRAKEAWTRRPRSTFGT